VALELTATVATAAGKTSNDALPAIVPDDAVTVACPIAIEVTTPSGVIVATDAGATDHMSDPVVIAAPC
jgi:hypothetical protein